jgi:hypothetical protein
MDEDPLLRLPVEQRRGCCINEGGNSWEAVLMAGGIDVVVERLKGISEMGSSSMM